MWWMVEQAFAASLAGLSVPFVGGGFAGPAEPGALGLIFDPSNAVLAPDPQIAADVGLIGVHVEMVVDALGEVGGTLPQVQPTLMAAVPFADRRAALGAAVFAPYVRSGESDPEGPFRLFGISSKIQFLEADVVAAARPAPYFALGASLRLGQFTLATTSAIDTGAMLNAALNPATPLPVGDALLEGHQTVEGVSDYTASWAVGATVGAIGRGPELHVAFKPAWKTGGTGALTLVPSDDLVARVEGSVDVTLVLPPSLQLAGRVPIGRVTFLPEIEWVGWSRTSNTVYDVRNLVLTTSDPLLNGILSDVGLSENALIEAQEGVRDTDLDWKDVLNLGLAASTRVEEDLELRAGIWRGPSAVQNRSASPGNLDFASWNVRAGAAWRATDRWRALGSLDVIPPSVRKVTDSKYDLYAPSTPEDALPSANGRYSLALVRVGLTLVYSFRGGAFASPSALSGD